MGGNLFIAALNRIYQFASEQSWNTKTPRAGGAPPRTARGRGVQGRMASMEELASALEDTQESLAAALARVEALRSREKNLVQDNARLRTKLRDLGVSEEDVGLSPRKDSVKTVDSPRSGDGQDLGDSGGEEADSAGFLNEDTRQHPVYIYTSSGKVLWEGVQYTIVRVYDEGWPLWGEPGEGALNIMSCRW